MFWQGLKPSLKDIPGYLVDKIKNFDKLRVEMRKLEQHHMESNGLPCNVVTEEKSNSDMKEVKTMIRSLNNTVKQLERNLIRLQNKHHIKTAILGRSLDQKGVIIKVDTIQITLDFIRAQLDLIIIGLQIRVDFNSINTIQHKTKHLGLIIAIFQCKINTKVKMKLKVNIKIKVKLNMEVKYIFKIKTNSKAKVKFQIKVKLHFKAKVKPKIRTNFKVKVSQGQGQEDSFNRVPLCYRCHQYNHYQWNCPVGRMDHSKKYLNLLQLMDRGAL